MATLTEKQETMFSIIESWRDSGQSQQAFCKAQGIAYSGFHYWYKKYRKAHEPEARSGFVPVQLQGEVSGLPVAALVLPDGRRMNFYHRLEASFLRTLLD